MSEHFESNMRDNKKNSEYRKNYGDGYAACVYGKEVKEIPFKDPESPETEAWYEGYNDGRTREKQEEIKKLERLYQKSE